MPLPNEGFVEFAGAIYDVVRRNKHPMGGYEVCRRELKVPGVIYGRDTVETDDQAANATLLEIAKLFYEKYGPP
jgi:hypothetical protein